MRKIKFNSKKACDEYKMHRVVQSDIVREHVKDFSNWLSEEIEIDVEKRKIFSLENEEYDTIYTEKEKSQRINKYIEEGE